MVLQCCAGDLPCEQKLVQRRAELVQRARNKQEKRVKESTNGSPNGSKRTLTLADLKYGTGATNFVSEPSGRFDICRFCLGFSCPP